MAIEKIILGEMGEVIDKINNNFNQLPPIIINSVPPSQKTVAQIIGQRYLNNITMDIYICSSIVYDESGIANENTVYEWNLISGKNKYPIIMGNGEPTNTTYAIGVGQLYIDKDINNLYICTNIVNSGINYIWYLIAKGNVFPIIIITDGIIGENISKGVGQLLIDIIKENLYMCIGKENNKDIWYPINTSSQQIICSSIKPNSTNLNNIWLKKI